MIDNKAFGGFCFICEGCKAKGSKKWHLESGECKALYSLVCASHKMPKNANGKRQLINLEMANGVDSSYVLTIRLMLRRWSEKNVPSPFPSVEWSLLDELYRAQLGTPDESQYYDAAMNELCRLMRESFCLKDEDQLEPIDGSWINKKDLNDTMEKVVGCGHAVTDVTASLGCQCIGRALFLEHSFYNHCCTPNSFLSCRIGDPDTNTEEHQCALNARLHCIQDIDEGGNVTISYIPTSGLSCDERKQRLEQSYDFICNCEACGMRNPSSKKMDQSVRLPENCDVECIRQMQFSCNQQLLEIERAGDVNNLQLNELESCISTIKMNKRGIRNQGIPVSHEVSIESHRLLAKALSLSDKVEAALKEYASFFPILELFDPVALATSLINFGIDLQRAGKDEECESVLANALEYAKLALGDEHKLVLGVQKMISETTERPTKRQKAENESMA